MEPELIELYLSHNADLHIVLPVNNPDGTGVDMTGWPFKLQLKTDELVAEVALDVTVTVQAVGELLLEASKANCAAIWPQGSTRKKIALVGDLITKPYNGAYIARIGTVKAKAERGVSVMV